MIDEFSKAKLCDFGLAAASIEGTAAATTGINNPLNSNYFFAILKSMQ
ncbi:MAG: hypothetical protein ACK4PR_14340 [Gammaproteobacteria bacterium]